MSYTIFTSNPADLIPQSGRSVSTFPSGIVRVDQTYLGLTAYAENHRSALAVGNSMPDGDNYPAINYPIGSDQTSLKIFPEVQETRREDGFTEYTVSAYGLTGGAGMTSRGFSIEKYSKSFNINQGDITLQYTIDEFWELETRTIIGPMGSNFVMENLPLPPENLFRRLRFRRITGDAPSSAQLELNWPIVILSLSRINFGHIDEVTITYGFEAIT